MRVAFFGVSHWHAPLYYGPAAALDGVEIVGVSDRDPRIAERVGRELGVPGYVDDERLVAQRPDFAFAFGRHVDMPALGRLLVDARVAFVIEKPAGLHAQDVIALRDRARERGVHVGTGFNFRVSDWFRRVRALTADDPASVARFAFISGPPARYRQLGCAWMLDPSLSGGGCTINLASHLVDLFRIFTATEPDVDSALMTSSSWGEPIEDYSVITLRSERASGVVETGYGYPAELGGFDLLFSLRTSKSYVVVRSDDVVEMTSADTYKTEVLHTPTGNFRWYPAFVAESIERFRLGQPPVADLDDLIAAMRVIDAAYSVGRRPRN
ncbi:MAG: Gfo/Idh/MocA family oxidoreductase [Chloroflexi bacterium]|nr:Gfo/Idh/MocA family oxidoreductase [Chloroflexota bacterium]